MPHKAKIPVPIQIEIINAYQSGRSARDVARAYNVHHSSVIDLSRRVGAPIRRVGRPRRCQTGRLLVLGRRT